MLSAFFHIFFFQMTIKMLGNGSALDRHLELIITAFKHGLLTKIRFLLRKINLTWLTLRQVRIFPPRFLTFLSHESHKMEYDEVIICFY